MHIRGIINKPNRRIRAAAATTARIAISKLLRTQIGVIKFASLVCWSRTLDVALPFFASIENTTSSLGVEHEDLLIF
jgi:hypothetical protein